MPEYETIAWENIEGIGFLTLNRPEKHNAMNLIMLREIGDRLEACHTDKSVKVIVLKGAGEDFCSGGDLKEHPFLAAESRLLQEDLIRPNHRIPMAIRRLPQPVIGALHGLVGGGGLDLALACDIRIAAEDARLGVLFTRIGLIPDMGGTYLLPRLVGASKALELMFTGDLIDAAEAHRIGLVNRVVDRGDLETAVAEFAARLARGPLQSYRINKKAVYRNMEQSIEHALEMELSGQCELVRTQDLKEAIDAFKQGRKPKFKGM